MEAQCGCQLQWCVPALRVDVCVCACTCVIAPIDLQLPHLSSPLLFLPLLLHLLTSLPNFSRLSFGGLPSSKRLAVLSFWILRLHSFSLESLSSHSESLHLRHCPFRIESASSRASSETRSIIAFLPTASLDAVTSCCVLPCTLDFPASFLLHSHCFGLRAPTFFWGAVSYHRAGMHYPPIRGLSTPRCGTPAVSASVCFGTGIQHIAYCLDGFNNSCALSGNASPRAVQFIDLRRS